MKNKSTMWILAALLFGIISGLVFHWLLPQTPANPSCPSSTP